MQNAADAVRDEEERARRSEEMRKNRAAVNCLQFEEAFFTRTAFSCFLSLQKAFYNLLWVPEKMKLTDKEFKRKRFTGESEICII